MLLRRFGGDASSNTLAARVVRVGQAVQPVINLMRDTLLESGLIWRAWTDRKPYDPTQHRAAQTLLRAVGGTQGVS